MPVQCQIRYMNKAATCKCLLAPGRSPDWKVSVGCSLVRPFDAPTRLRMFVWPSNRLGEGRDGKARTFVRDGAFLLAWHLGLCETEDGRVNGDLVEGISHSASPS